MTTFVSRVMSVEAADEIYANYAKMPNLTEMAISGGRVLVFSHTHTPLLKQVSTPEKSLMFFNRAFFKEMK